MARETGREQVGALEFERLIALLLEAEFGTAEVQYARDVVDSGFDFVVRQGGRRWLIEVKVPTPQTLGRARLLASQLKESVEREGRSGRDTVALLVVPGVVSPRFTEPFEEQGIQVWDKRRIDELIRRHGPRASGELSRLIERYHQIERKESPNAAEELANRLGTIPCGRQHAYRYQDLCTEIFDLLFCPPLEKPLTERRNDTGVNRRDIILPNYATGGFWQFMREAYHADYAVLDAKNLCGEVKKNHVLQLANYLAVHGTGLFGILLTRTGSERSAGVIRREQWALHQKLILVLTDDDLRQMLLAVAAGGTPEGTIRQKIEDFRLGV